MANGVIDYKWTVYGVKDVINSCSQEQVAAGTV